MKKVIVKVIIVFVILAVIIGLEILLWEKRRPKQPTELPEDLSKQEETISERPTTTTEPKKTYPMIKDEPVFSMSSFHHLDTTGWLTYKAKEGFSVKYPSNKWRIEQWPIYGPSCFTAEGKILEECKDTKLKTKYSINDINEYNAYDLHLIIDVWENDKELSLEDWIKEDLNAQFICYSLSLSIKDITGLVCENTWYRTPDWPTFYDFYLGSDDLIYEFSLYDRGQDFSKAKEVYETIFSTFRTE